MTTRDKLMHAVTAFDRKQQDKARAPKRGYYNVYAITLQDSTVSTARTAAQRLPKGSWLRQEQRRVVRLVQGHAGLPAGRQEIAGSGFAAPSRKESLS